MQLHKCVIPICVAIASQLDVSKQETSHFPQTIQKLRAPNTVAV